MIVNKPNHDNLILLEHFRKFIGEPSLINIESVSESLNINLVIFEANEKRNYHTIITSGMSLVPSNVSEENEDWKYTELMMYLPASWPVTKDNIKEFEEYWPLGWLRKLGKFPNERDTWFCYGDTIPNGEPPEPIASNTKFSCMLLLPPIREDEGFFSLDISEEKTIQFLVVFPIYKEEMEFHLTNGFNAVLEKFDEYDVNDIVDINRINMCKS
ncbi:suppressor of fused domain protein [Paenibacillus arenosi]|uniref:Suppressor of fused domain protein n=1 Tax=Paenibacillus arenosi TaxID=2774142 RepID=A0ABR9AXE6_9BACL|nr:suppressor of fused domain protein [Paenibacillus arenosi]MBD8498793.1 suppressor of fused domain protein [Paenibacillus arenosi]